MTGVQTCALPIYAAVAGSSKLLSGLDQLNNGIAQMDQGSNKLDAGATQLAAGMTKFNQQGIRKFIGTLKKAELNKIAGRLEATVEASKHEVFVGGKDSSMSDESRLIFKSGEIKASK